MLQLKLPKRFLEKYFRFEQQLIVTVKGEIKRQMEDKIFSTLSLNVQLFQYQPTARIPFCVEDEDLKAPTDHQAKVPDS
ncbi:hypothetical protein RRG08_025170 [Elysia crispata]|uniref:Uncharacterized protein n=1 Tax=Elysia crispata TaxID=231223 RepID=A0AAE1DD01_9GAST|nr:hypothetical protein RRG08_025170 [Elysia crispata]